MQRFYRVFVCLLLLSWLLAACGGAQTGVNAGEESEGQTLYNQNGCLGCHPVTAKAGYAPGPGLFDLADRVEAIIADPSYTGQAKTVRGYLEESILDPNIYLTEGYEPVMPEMHQMTLTEPQVEAIVDYILTLK